MYIPPVSEAIEKNTYYEPKDPSEIDLIPKEIAFDIFSMLSIEDVSAFSYVSHKWEMWTNDYFPIGVKERWPFVYKRREARENTPDWKAIFAEKVRIKRNLSIGKFCHTTINRDSIKSSGTINVHPIGEEEFSDYRNSPRSSSNDPLAFPHQLSIIRINDGKLIQAFDWKGEGSDKWEGEGSDKWVCNHLIWTVIDEVLHAWDFKTGKLHYQLSGWKGVVVDVHQFQNQTIIIKTKTGEDQYSVYIVDQKDKKLILLCPPEGAKDYPNIKQEFSGDFYFPQLNKDSISMLWVDNYNHRTRFMMAEYPTHSSSTQLQPSFQIDFPILLDDNYGPCYYEFEGFYFSQYHIFTERQDILNWRICLKSSGQLLPFDKKIRGFACFPGKVILLLMDDKRMFTLQELSTEAHKLDNKLSLGHLPNIVRMRQVEGEKMIILLTLNDETGEGNLTIIDAQCMQVKKQTPFTLKLKTSFFWKINHNIHKIKFDEEKISILCDDEIHFLDFRQMEATEIRSFKINWDGHFKKNRPYTKGEDLVFEDHQLPDPPPPSDRPFVSKTVILASIVALAAFSLYFRNRL